MSELPRARLEQLLSDYQTGRDREGCAELLAAHYRRRVKKMIPAGPSPEEREDLTQEVLLRVFKRWDKIEPSAPRLDTYYYRTTKSVFANYLRKKIRRREGAKRIAEEPAIESGGNSPEESMLEREEEKVERKRARQLLNALDELSPRQRQVVRLQLRGLSQSKIAKRLRLETGTVKKHSFDARQRLKGLLG